MRFSAVPLKAAEGKILGHNLAGANGRRLFKKGTALTAVDLEKIENLGRNTVYVAELEPGDLDENSAARRVAKAVMGSEMRMVGPSAGRVNLLSEALGILRVDSSRLGRINECDGITIATLLMNSPVQPKKISATIKIIPFAVPDHHVKEVERICQESGPVITVDRFASRRISVIFSGSPSIRERLMGDFQPLFDRIAALGSNVAQVEFIPLEDENDEIALSKVLVAHLQSESEIIILAGETAIMDREDIAPRAIVRAGGSITCVGVPVDPGNLLMLGYLGEVPVLGVPGCARSNKTNIVDWALPRLFAGDRLARQDFIRLGHGGLLEDTRSRPMPRSKLK